MTVKPFVAYREVSYEYLQRLDDEGRRIMFNDMKESAVRELARILLESDGCKIEVSELINSRNVRFDMTVYVEANHHARDHAGNYIPPENRPATPRADVPYTMPLPDGRIVTSTNGYTWALSPAELALNRDAVRTMNQVMYRDTPGTIRGLEASGLIVDDPATPINTGTELAIRATNRDRDFSPWDVVAADSPVVRDMQDSIRRLRAGPPALIQAWNRDDVLTINTAPSYGITVAAGDMVYQGVPLVWNSAFDHLDAAHEAQIRDDNEFAARTPHDSNPPT